MSSNIPTIAYATNALSTTGIGVQAEAILRELKKAQNYAVTEYHLDADAGTVRKEAEVIGRIQPWPGIVGTKTISWMRLGRKIPTFLKGSDVLHLTNQALSFIRAPHTPTVITVHDIIELTNPQSSLGGLAARYLYRGIAKAEAIIAVSEYTATAIHNQLQVPRERIRVIYNGVDDTFFPIDDFTHSIGSQVVRQELKLPAESCVVLFVGSDHPRKNVVGALRAFAEARQTSPELIFVKVGSPGLLAGREATLAAIDELGIRPYVRFVTNVSAERLNELYNLASVVLLPSYHEGFGLPPLQAMAAGTPTIVSNMTALPEVVGDDDRFGVCASVLHDPADTSGQAASMVKIINDVTYAEQMRAAGIARARQFSWQTAATKVAEVYRSVLSV